MEMDNEIEQRSWTYRGSRVLIGGGVGGSLVVFGAAVAAIAVDVGLAGSLLAGRLLLRRASAPSFILPLRTRLIRHTSDAARRLAGEIWKHTRNGVQSSGVTAVCSELRGHCSVFRAQGSLQCVQCSGVTAVCSELRGHWLRNKAGVLQCLWK